MGAGRRDSMTQVVDGQHRLGKGGMARQQQRHLRRSCVVLKGARAMERELRPNRTLIEPKLPDERRAPLCSFRQKFAQGWYKGAAEVKTQPDKEDTCERGLFA